MNAGTQTVVLDNAVAPPGSAGPLAEQQETTIALSTALNDMQNVGARLLAGWRASLQRQGELEGGILGSPMLLGQLERQIAELTEERRLLLDAIYTAIAEASSGLPDHALARLEQTMAARDQGVR